MKKEYIKPYLVIENLGNSSMLCVSLDEGAADGDGGELGNEVKEESSLNLGSKNIWDEEW